MSKVKCEWDVGKDRQNQKKHGVPFEVAQYAFADPQRVIAEDLSHSQEEKRYYCFGKVGDGILTVRFTYRGRTIRILGAGYWRKGKKIYEKENKIHE
ncbi:MAG: BrnT family toxin [Nitrospiria bacterium]